MSKIISKLFIAIILLAIIPVVSAGGGECECTGTPVIPNDDKATVNGDYTDWDITENSDDFFGDMFAGGQNDVNHHLLSKAYVRYDCVEQILYVLVLLEDGNTIDNTLSNPDQNHYVKLGCGGGGVLVDASARNNGDELPDFEYITNDNGDKVGWEASAKLIPGTHNLRVQTQVNGDEVAQTSAFIKRCIKLDICCTPIPEFPTIALPIAAILGIMFILQNRRRKED